MTDLQVINHNGQLVVDSREVAEMVDKRHADLMRDIKNYCDILTNADLRSLNFFFESTYKDQKGEIRPCYLLTKKGCDMVANKMTGEKGVIFTAAYIDKFYEMEDKLKKPALDEDFAKRKEIVMMFRDADKEVRELIIRLFSDYMKLPNTGFLEADEISLFANGPAPDAFFRKLVGAEMGQDNVSYRELARRTGISRETARKVLIGKRCIHLNMADKILKALGLTLVLGKGGDEK